MGEKIFHILGALPVAGKPVAILSGYDNRNTTTFMVRKGEDVTLPKAFIKEHGMTDVTSIYEASSQARLDLPTDDWPFFYMDVKAYPATYVISLLLILALAFAMVRQLLPRQKWSPALLPFFWLGGGFMLVETKAITELGLLFGNTWYVIGITIIAVLIMAFLANLLAAGLRRPVTAYAYGGLIAVLIVGYALASQGGVLAPSIAVKLMLTALLASPLFFSGLLFSGLLKKTGNISGAMAYNLMGAMLGGVLEYNAMQFGFASLYLIALALYALAGLFTWRAKRAPG
jgi:hypothetical protein